MARGGGGKDTLFLTGLVLMIVCVWGPAIALMLKGSLQEMAGTLGPIVLPILITLTVIIAVKKYWSKW